MNKQVYGDVQQEPSQGDNVPKLRMKSNATVTIHCPFKFGLKAQTLIWNGDASGTSLSVQHSNIRVMFKHKSAIFFRELQTSRIDEDASTTFAKTIPTAKFHFRTLTTRRIITSLIRAVRMKKSRFSTSCFLRHIKLHIL